MRKLVFISSSDYDSLKRKGVDQAISERAEGGLFERVYSVHLFAHITREIILDRGNVLLEFGKDQLPWWKNRILFRLSAPLYFLLALIKLRKLIRKIDPDVVRVSDPFFSAVVCGFACLGLKPWIVSIHSDWDKRLELDGPKALPCILGSPMPAKLTERLTYMMCDSIFCVRKTLIEYAVKNGASPSKCVYFPHCIPDDFYAKERVNGKSSSESKFVLFAGRLTRENYIFDCLKIARILSYRKNIYTLIAGEGPEYRECQRIVSRDPILYDSVIFLGFIERNRCDYYRRHSLINLCLMGGYSLIESSASGRPVACYDVEWHRELVNDDSVGLIVPEGEYKVLCDLIIQKLENPGELDVIGKKMGLRSKRIHSVSAVRDLRHRRYIEFIESQKKYDSI